MYGEAILTMSAPIGVKIPVLSERHSHLRKNNRANSTRSVIAQRSNRDSPAIIFKRRVLLRNPTHKRAVNCAARVISSTNKHATGTVLAYAHGRTSPADLRRKLPRLVGWLAFRSLSMYSGRDARYAKRRPVRAKIRKIPRRDLLALMKRATGGRSAGPGSNPNTGPVTCSLTNKLRALSGRKWGRATAFAENPRGERKHNGPPVDHDQ